MVIEQTLTRFFGTDLKHAIGVKVGVLAGYLLAIPLGYNVLESPQNYCALVIASSNTY